MMFKVFLVLLGFQIIGSLRINSSSARSRFLVGEWLTISELASRHSEWLVKDEELSRLIEQEVYIVSAQYRQLFVDSRSNAICKVNQTSVTQDIQQDVCSLEYVCGKPFNKCYEEDTALENLIFGDIYIMLNKKGLPHQRLQ